MEVRSSRLYLLVSFDRCYLACIARDLSITYLILSVQAKGDILDPVVIESSDSSGESGDEQTSIPK